MKTKQTDQEKKERYWNVIKTNLVIGLLFPIIIAILPLISFLFLNELISLLSAFYQFIGIYLLYYEEKYKMDHNNIKYAKLNTFFLKLKDSWSNVKLACRELFRLYTDFYKEESDIRLVVTSTIIDHDYSEEEDKDKRLEKQLLSMENDLAYLRYFSEVRKFGYILIAIGFLLQFIVSLSFLYLK